MMRARIDLSVSNTGVNYQQRLLFNVEMNQIQQSISEQVDLACRMITNNDVNCTLRFNEWKDVTDIFALAMVSQLMRFFKLNMCHTVEGTINYPSCTFSSTRQPTHKERCMTKYDTCPLEHLILGSILPTHPSYSAN